MNVQIIEKAGQPEWAVLAYEDYLTLMAHTEMLDDVQAYDEAKRRVATGEELVPSAVTYALLDGANPIRVWREHRGLTQQQLAHAASVSKPYLSQLEAGKRTGSAAILSRLAAALQLIVDDLLPA